ncbi:hypothetical protein D805_0947 [Bifidobacterium thermophilum RBL67]|uniref:Uncharacterized protein n=1 Tax=Bifidobacterium thermophilum RBL67 TaxID=1254439 RepID=M4RG99_9BIFI|nr:hypothetical protein D805_0947 [Bifidobacterium thermophilum RBL67]
MLIGRHDLVVRCEPAHIASLLTLPGFGPTIKADHDTWMFIKLDGTVDLPTMADYLTSSYAMASQPAEDVDVQATRFSAPETKMNPIATLEGPSQQSVSTDDAASTRARMHDTVYTDTPIPIKPAASGAPASGRTFCIRRFSGMSRMPVASLPTLIAVRASSPAATNRIPIPQIPERSTGATTPSHPKQPSPRT